MSEALNSEVLSADDVRKIDAYWRAANYLSVGQMYLDGNPLLREPLNLSHVKPLAIGNWRTTPAHNFIYAHLNRVIKKFDLNMLYVAGPGRGGTALVSNTYLEGTYSEVYSEMTQDEPGLTKLFKQFSVAAGRSRHVGQTAPGAIHEGGELSYALSHAFGAALDNPDLIVACVIGSAEAQMQRMAINWQASKSLNPITDGVVLPILHLDNYTLSDSTEQALMEHEELEQFLRGCGWTPRFVEGHDSEAMHELMAAALDRAIDDIRIIRELSLITDHAIRPRWPMIVLVSVPDWTRPHGLDGLQVEETFGMHQVPLVVDSEHPDHVRQLELWMKSYNPEELFDRDGRLMPELAELIPKGDRRMGANPHANGGILLRKLTMPDLHDHGVHVPSFGAVDAQDTLVLGRFLFDLGKLNRGRRDLRVFGTSEIISNLLGQVVGFTERQRDAHEVDNDELHSSVGRVLKSMVSEYQCEGWLEGYLLTGRHGLLISYEAFIPNVEPMLSQHLKWLKATLELPWRRKIASLNYLLASHVWQQGYTGITHQGPSFIDHVVGTNSDRVCVYLPPDANCLLSVFHRCLRSQHCVNVVVAGNHPFPQWLSMRRAILHCMQGIGIWQWASSDQEADPDVVMACCGDTTTLEVLAAVSILREHLPELRIRVVNVVDLMKLQPAGEHPHGLSDSDYDSLFTKDKPIVFAFHGYSWLIHRLTYRRTNRNLHVRGYKEEATITTDFDERVQNDVDRFHLVEDVLDRVPKMGETGSHLRQLMRDKLSEHRQYIDHHGVDMPEIRNWKWTVLK